MAYISLAVPTGPHRCNAFHDLEGEESPGLLPGTVKKPIVHDREGNSRISWNRFESPDLLLPTENGIAPAVLESNKRHARAAIPP